MQARAQAFASELARRRTVRDYAPTPIPDGVLDDCIRAAGAAPSGANLQPWHFVVVTDPAIKARIREAAEAEETEQAEDLAEEEVEAEQTEAAEHLAEEEVEAEETEEAEDLAEEVVGAEEEAEEEVEEAESE